jgi:hypothetical protein
MEVNFSDKTPATPANAVLDVASTVTPVATPAGVVRNTDSQVGAGAPTPAASQLPATSSGLLLGDRLPEMKDIILPRLNLVQNLGGMTESFENGTIVYSKQVELFVPGKVNTQTQTLERPATAPVIMTVLGFKDTLYYEKVKFEGGVRGTIVKTEKEVRDSGGTLDYNEWKLKEKDGMKRFECGADCMLAIERPEIAKDNETDFTFEVEGKFYALAMWNFKGSLYNAAARRVLFPARVMGCLKKKTDPFTGAISGGYTTWSYAFSSREEKWGAGVQSWIPVCVPNQKNSPEFLNFAKSVLGA